MQAARRSSETHLSLDDSEGDDDVRPCFPCPFCYVDIELPVLTIHLQDEHCFDAKTAVCPVCAANLGKDMIGHFTVQHSHLLKRRRKSQRSGLWTNTTAMFGKELRELSSFLGLTSSNALPDAKVDQDESTSIGDTVASTSLDTKSTVPSAVDGFREQDKEEIRQRAEFVQQLMLSAIF